MNLFGWHIFENDEPKPKPKPSRASARTQQAPAPKPSPSTYGQQNSEYYANHRGTGESSPGVWSRPGPQKSMPQGLPWWQSLLNSIGGEPVYGIGNPPGKPDYSDLGAARAIINDRKAYEAEQARAQPSYALAAAGLPFLQQWNYTQPGAAYNTAAPAETPTATPAPTPTATPTAAPRAMGAGAKMTGQMVPPPLVADPAGLNRVNAQLLRDMGWTVPDVARAAYDQGMLDMAGAKDLQAYSYGVGADELALLAGAYKGLEGFTPGQQAPGKSATVQGGVTRAVPLTWDAYNALSEDQRRAVDFNTVLLEAREADLRKEGMPEYDQATYDARVADMFGARGGSATYAPHVVDLLERIGFSARGQDLDEYLSLERGITADEIKDFKIGTEGLVQWEWPEGAGKRASTAAEPEVDVWFDANGQRHESPHVPGTAVTSFNDAGQSVERIPNRYGESRSVANQLIVDSIAVQRAGKAIDEMLKDPASWGFGYAAKTLATGAPPLGTDTPFGFGSTSDRMDSYGNVLTADRGKDEFFADQYAYLQNPANDMNLIWDKVNEAGMDDTAVQQLFNFFDLKTKKDILIGFSDPDLRSPQDIRKLTGLEG